jgi:hypothetical protein
LFPGRRTKCRQFPRYRRDAAGGRLLYQKASQYGPQAALIAEAFTPRLRCSGASPGYQQASVIAGGPAPLIATALFASYHSGYAISIYIAACAMVSLVKTAMMPDYTGQDISMMMTDNLAVVLADR